VREDPDVMLVGEMRDKETFMTAIHAAETGHLVFGTIHASSAATTIGRILDLFPSDVHSALRSAIAFNMRGIIAQKLLKSIKPGVGRVPTVEIMVFNANVNKPSWKRTTKSCPTSSASASTTACRTSR
jgi:twitching motility protein PilT